MTQSRPNITGTTHTLPFDKLSPRQFERMCLWLVEREGYERAEHLGAAGSEQGRDIVAWRRRELWAFQCKRVQRFGPKDALAEVEKVLALPEDQRPVGLVFLVTCDVSANTRQQVRERCAGEMECHFWTGTELDEKVKCHKRIVQEFFRTDWSGPSVYTTEQIRAHCTALTTKTEYRRWADEFYIHEEGKILPLFASPYEDDTGQQRRDLLQTIREHDRLLVLGEPGIGKTVALQRMMWEAVQADDAIVPIFIPLLFFQGDLVECVRVALSETGELCFDNAKAVRAFLRQMPCLIMFDGLNEVRGGRRKEAVAAIAGFLREFSKHRYVVTSRSQDELWKKLRASDTIKDTVVIQRITDEQARSYLIAHLGDHRGRDLHDRLNECLRGLSHTPLLLWLIKEAGLAGEELPGNRGELFDRFVDRVLRRDEEKLEVQVPSTAKRLALAHLAFVLQKGHLLACVREEAEKTLAKVVIKYDTGDVVREVLIHGLLEGERQVRFLHQSVQEYFVGLALCEMARAERAMPNWSRVGQRLLRRNLAALARDDWWAESFVQMAGLTKDPDWLAHELVTVKPWLAFWCSFEGKPVDENTRTVVENETVALLHSDDIDQRLRAAKELGRFENPRTVEYLMLALADQESEVIGVAERALVRLGEPAVESLLIALRDSEQRVRWAAIRALGHIWELAELVRLGNADTEARLHAVDALGDLKDIRALEPLVATLEDSEGAVQIAAAEALGKLEHQDAAEPLLAILEGDSVSIRQAATQALGQIWHLPDLIRLGDSSKQARTEASEALGELRDGRAVKPLIAVLRDEYDVRQKAALALGKIGNAAKDLVLAALTSSSVGVRVGVTKALGEIRDSWATTALKTALRDPDWQVSLGAAEALGRQGHSKGMRFLADALESKDDRIRMRAVSALETLRNSRAESSLIAALKDEFADVRRTATRALGHIWQIPDVVKLGNISTQVRSEAAKVLGNSKDPRIIEPLIAALKDSDSWVRRAAIEALEQQGNAAAELLIAALEDAVTPKDSDSWVQQTVIAALKQQGNAAVDPLAVALEGARIARLEYTDSHRTTLRSLIKALASLGNVAVRPLATVIGRGGRWERAEAAEALRGIGTPEALAVVRKYEARK